MSTLEYSKIPDHLFKPVVKVRDILRARILSSDEKRKINHGGPDIYVMSPMGTSNLLTRDSIIKYYKYVDGSKIKLSSWKSKLSYIVIANDKGEAYAFKVPNNINIKMGDKVVPSGGYIICESSDGEINRQKAFVIKKEYFKKMFRAGAMPGTDRGKTKRENVREEVKAEYIVDKVIYKAIAKAVQSGKTVGFILQSEGGDRLQVNKAEIVNLCSRKQVSNIILNRTAENKPYLQGQGIKISELPTVEI